MSDEDEMAARRAARKAMFKQAVALGETLVQSRIARGEDYSQHIYDDSEGDGRGRQGDGAD